MSSSQSNDTCCTDSCGCVPKINRREFARLASLGTVALSLNTPAIMAGPFADSDFDYQIPEDKKLDPRWVDSLFVRGKPEILQGKALQYVGMPIGGICAGQLYLGGDGKLWHWDIFNYVKGTGDSNYSKPPSPESPLEQKFYLKLGDKEISLDNTGFTDISFRGEYPIGLITYKDSQIPVVVNLEAYSPYIPLNTEDSSLPATILEYTITNTSQIPLSCELIGMIENAVLLNNRNTPGKRRIQSIVKSDYTSLCCTAEVDDTLGADINSHKNLPDYGTMALTLLGKAADTTSLNVSKAISETLNGEIGRKLDLNPGQSVIVQFILTWHFPNIIYKGKYPKGINRVHSVSENKQFYAAQFLDAFHVADYIAKNFSRLSETTKLWRNTWYDSTLPYWFLDRTQVNTSTLATSTCLRFSSGRFWAWEGVGCCEGTCTHVWHYAQAMARQFPELERILRERIDFGLALQSDGAIHFRAENNKIPAIDGQAGSILRALREHQMSKDDAFLKRIWPQIKQATNWLISKDANEDGIIESNQHNTLDSDWYGAVAWLSSLYISALSATAQLADEMQDKAYALKCRKILKRGQNKLVTELFNKEYFINKVDSKHLNAINSGTGCEIDQVMGQSWAFQVGMPRILPEIETRKALQSLWKYNFSPDVGPYRAHNKTGRWYAMAGEAGLLMCTFPRKDWNFKNASGVGNKQSGFAGYFNECMNGFEYQVAGHMLWENMVLEGMAITRAVHDRYNATKRNPWNEVECGDHYARSMASYGVFLAACGFEYHGPLGHIGFAPRLTPAAFKCPFTAAEGWGNYSQTITPAAFNAVVSIKWGSLSLNSLSIVSGINHRTVSVKQGSSLIPASFTTEEGKTKITLSSKVVLTSHDELSVRLT